MPWRDNTDPYWILVSELMLQQTQVSRVIPKFSEFIATFPNVASLAKASFEDVLRAWSGLGYNRRAKFLHQTAQKIMSDYDGTIPQNITELVKLPGIGPNTAGAICVYAYNQPVAFIETNIRSVYLHHFFADRTDVDDREILPLIKQSLPHDNPREWYWALMDYGAHLKATRPNPSRASRHHVKQSKFEGSDRQLRGKILKLLLQRPHSYKALQTELNDNRTKTILEKLADEGFIVKTKQTYYLK